MLAARRIPNASPALLAALEIPQGQPCLALVSTDCDDATFIALDEATKAAEVQVSLAVSMYAGAGNATTPHAGEALGILSAATPGAAQSGLDAALAVLARLGFSAAGPVPFLAHTVSSCGSFLAREAGVPTGSALAYLIAPPLESMVGLDAALKAADVRLCKLYTPPTHTNFGGGLLTGTQSACAAACAAFAQAVARVAAEPVEGPERRNHGI